ncbi:MAG: nitrous oxide reductase family maturation protein NosD, partial [Flavobacteriaceae bacterium]|nr:nitrous oxide reductase family maturation protein NosD [Flavobacteriaceae bacterium]
MRLSTIFLVVFLMSISCFGNTIEVCTSCNVKSLKEAVLNSKDHDTILVKKGTYYEFGITIDKPLTLLGQDYPVINGEEKGEIMTIISDNVTIDGFFIINVGTSYIEDYAAIRVRKSKNFKIQNIVLEKLFFGIYIEKSSQGKIYHNKIIGNAKNEYNSGNGIQLWYSHDIEIEHNYVEKVRDGIYLEFSDNCIIRNNVSEQNLRYGLHFMFSNDDIYEGNVFEDNGAGVAVMFSKNIKMLRNSFNYNWGTASYGLLLKEINDAEIIGNIFNENTIGINIEGSNRILYQNNNFKNNGWAIKVRGACYGNRFLLNNFFY